MPIGLSSIHFLILEYGANSTIGRYLRLFCKDLACNAHPVQVEAIDRMAGSIAPMQRDDNSTQNPKAGPSSVDGGKRILMDAVMLAASGIGLFLLVKHVLPASISSIVWCNAS